MYAEKFAAFVLLYVFIIRFPASIFLETVLGIFPFLLLLLYHCRKQIKSVVKRHIVYNVMFCWPGLGVPEGLDGQDMWGAIEGGAEARC